MQVRALMGAAAALLLAGVTGAAAAGSPLVAAYTDVDFNLCTTIESDDMGSTSACPGWKGYPVVIAEGDLRMFVSYGLKPLEERAAEQTLPPFNHLGGKMEWRLTGSGDDQKPVATILRWFTDRTSEGKKPGEVLVVTQIKPGATCHIAYIDAEAVPNANDRARQIADKAGSFDCTKDPEIVQPFRLW